MHLPYNKKLKTFSRNLRNSSTFGEVMLWKELRSGKLDGFKFNRQKPLGNYIADFYCKSLNLVIEIDGFSHLDPKVAEKDVVRENFLISLGLTVLRFKEGEVIKEREAVLSVIRDFIHFKNLGGKSP